MESNFIARVIVGKVAEWLQNLLMDTKLWPQLMAVISLTYNSQTTMSSAYSEMYNGKFRNMDMKCM